MTTGVLIRGRYLVTGKRRFYIAGLKIEKGAKEKGMWADSRSWQKPGYRFSP